MTVLFRNEEGVRERPFLIQPLSVAPEPAQLRHLRNFQDIIFVAALGPYGFASLEPYREARPRNCDGLF